MSNRTSKWHHRWLGTVDVRRRIRDRTLRRIGLARCRTPLPLVGRDDLLIPSIVSGAAAEILLREGDLSFVQVGAYDGRSEDDLTSMIDLPGVRGLLVEPQPEPFAELQRRYGDCSNVQLANVAIAPIEGQRNFYRPRSGPSRLASFDQANLIRHGVALQDIVCESVECLPLDALLNQLQIDRLDVLQIDAEGYDLEVLATLDFDRWQPRWLRFEFLHLDPKKLATWLDHLAQRRYRFFVQQRDIVAIQPALRSKAA